MFDLVPRFRHHGGIPVGALGDDQQPAAGAKRAVGGVDEKFGDAVVGVVGRVSNGEVVLPCPAVDAVAAKFGRDVRQPVERGASESTLHRPCVAVDGVNGNRRVARSESERDRPGAAADVEHAHPGRHLGSVDQLAGPGVEPAVRENAGAADRLQ